MRQVRENSARKKGHNFVSSNMNIGLTEKQSLLEEVDLKKRAILVLELLTKELQMLEMKNIIQT